MIGIAYIQMSQLCGEIDDKVNAFRARRLAVSVDRRHLREGPPESLHRFIEVIVAVGVNSDGRREVGPSEAKTFWTAFLRKLARRGLRGVKLAVSTPTRASRPP